MNIETNYSENISCFGCGIQEYFEKVAYVKL